MRAKAATWARPGRDDVTGWRWAARGAAWATVLLLAAGAVATSARSLDPNETVIELTRMALAEKGERGSSPRLYTHGSGTLGLLGGRGWTLTLYVRDRPEFAGARFFVAARVGRRLEVELMRSAGVGGTTTAVGPEAEALFVGCGLDLARLDELFLEAVPAPRTALLGARAFLALVLEDPAGAEALLERGWRDEYGVMLLEALPFLTGERRTVMQALLERATGGRRESLQAWFDWAWRPGRTLHPEYAAFKAELYSKIDPRFREYFLAIGSGRIGLDEVVWGGVVRDGIPPLRSPRLEDPASASRWLADDHVVFGLEVDGVPRAYPRRVLAWHELVTDVVGSTPVTGVYCPLCGSMVAYRSIAGGVLHELGTSGFLYRSNKLMYDQATRSLWSTLEGRPVLGPLATSDIALERLPIVTTTWGEWRRRHPQTTALSIETGHSRDYGEGVAYRDYLSTDELMFPVAERDGRLRNKAEVLGLHLAGGAPLAITRTWLAERPVASGTHGDVRWVVFTDAAGAHRVYRSRASVELVTWDGAGEARDSLGRSWRVAEDGLHRAGEASLPRLPAHVSFWFGWRAAFPETHLVGDR